MSSVDRDACAVLLPLIVDLEISADVRSLFERGCVSLLVGETGDEYAAGAMTPERVASETPEAIKGLVDGLATIAGGPVTIAVDQELAGIERLHRLVPSLPTKDECFALGPDGVEAAAEATARGMRALGVTWTLAPTLEVVRGVNPWLAQRHLGPDPEVVSAITSAFIRGMAKGGVVSCAKHFPGCGDAATDPHHGEVHIATGREEFDAVHLPSFRSALAAGVGTVMTGPAIIDCIDPVNPVTVSKANLQGLLREELGFTGLVVSVDLDSPATALGVPVPQRAVDALAAGCDLLLVGLPDAGVAAAAEIVRAVEDGRLSRERLADAAARARALAASTAS